MRGYVFNVAARKKVDKSFEVCYNIYTDSKSLKAKQTQKTIEYVNVQNRH